MPQLLLEILSEEIPARMQAKAEADLVKALMDGLTAAGLIPEGIKGFSGPRRLVAVVEGLPVKSADVVEDIQGPKEGAPQPAIDGFLRKAGLRSIAEAHLHDVPKKGRIYIAHVKKPGRETAALVAELVPSIIRNFHWPKSMRWGSGDLRWVRPISRILCTFDGEVVPFEVDGIRSGNLTEGHRVMGRGPWKVRRFDDYEDVIKNKGRVILDREERKEIILTEAKQLCAAQNLELVEDIGLLEEVAGLAEWPVVIIGDMDKSFLDLPPEVIRLSMRTHQKYFAVRDPMRKDGGLAPKFIVVANLDAADAGEKIAAGNSRVLSARLNDARFFWDNDRKVKLQDRFEKLGQIVFHEKLGTVKDKAERVMALAKELAPKVGADPAQAERAAKLAKCDLVSDMVGEFPELEGVMGRYYALLEAGLDPNSTPASPNESSSGLTRGSFSSGGQKDSRVKPENDSVIGARAVADAVRDHYKPKGPSDEVPSGPVAVAVALADKLDTLFAFWAIDEKPTGSKDPYALRRAALGVIRLLLSNNIRIRFFDDWTVNPWMHLTYKAATHGYSLKTLQKLEALATSEARGTSLSDEATEDFTYEVRRKLLDLLSFFADRLKVYLREQGARHDLIDAVFALGEDDLVLIVKRVEALGAFLDTEDGKNLLAGYRRAANILKAEEKGGEKFEGKVHTLTFKQPEEHALHAALERAAPDAAEALEKENFAAAMKALSKLRGPVDAFFEHVTVNADDPILRTNRLRLLAQIRDALNRVADFSKIEG
jgi:glycyl-tRNA synthetase beta chain